MTKIYVFRLVYYDAGQTWHREWLNFTTGEWSQAQTSYTYNLNIARAAIKGEPIDNRLAYGIAYG